MLIMRNMTEYEIGHEQPPIPINGSMRRRIGYRFTPHDLNAS